MPVATIRVAGKADPEMGKKRGRIKSDDGMLFQADPGFLSQVNVGSAYEITYKDDEWKGAKYRVVEGVVPSMGTGVRGGYQPPAGGQRPAAPMTGSGAGVKIEDRRGEDIATLAIVKEWIGRIPVGDTGAVVHALRSARAAWLQFKAGGDAKIESGPSLRDEMDDHIPEL